MALRLTEALLTTTALEVGRVSSAQIPDEGLDRGGRVRLVALATVLPVDVPRVVEDVRVATFALEAGPRAR